MWWTLETLSATDAELADVCGRIQEVATAEGFEATCLPGAVAPSTWTLESHVRLLWPEYNAGDLRVQQRPGSSSRSGLARIAAHHGGRYAFGSDNPVFDLWNPLEVGDGTVWTLGAEYVDIGVDVRTAVYEPVDGRASGRTVAEIGRWIREGDPVTAYLNSFDVGSHVPRCAWGLEDPRCRLAWQWAMDYHLVAPEDDPAESFSSSVLWVKLLETHAKHYGALEPVAMRRDVFNTAQATVEGAGLDNLSLLLAELLEQVRRAGRQEDLVMVMAGDHGDAPCANNPIANSVICGHDQTPTEWHAAVPAVVIGAVDEVARWEERGWVAEDGRAWALGNLMYGLLDATGQELPSHWPKPPPAGTAASWTCEPEGKGAVRIEDGRAEWCGYGGCVQGPWRLPELEGMTVGADDAAAAGEVESTGWFESYCLPSGPVQR